MASAFTYVGYLQSVKKEENEDKDATDDSGEREESVTMDNDSFGKSKNRIRLREGVFVPFTDNGHGDAFTVRGKFHLTGPWWKIKFKIAKTKNAKKRRHVTMLDGYFQYGLRDDKNVASENLVSLLLTDCEISHEAKQSFVEFLKSRGEFTSLTLTNMTERIENMLQHGHSVEQNAAAEQMKNHMSVAIPYYYVTTAQLHPDIFLYGAKLFTTKFHKVLLSMRGDPDTISRFAKLFTEKPWVLGFYALLNRGFRIQAEAEIVPLIETELFDRIEPLQQDALLVYSVLKYANFNDGHTYVTVSQIRQHRSLERSAIRKYKYIRDMDGALDWLVKEKIVIREEWGKEDRVALVLWYNYEKTIAEGLTKLVENHKTNPLKFDVDFERPEFELIRNDEDQMRAVRAICQHPVVLMSGKGGCGKTVTVSVLLNYVKMSGMLEAREQDMNQSQNSLSNDMDDSKHSHPLAAQMGLTSKTNADHVVPKTPEFLHKPVAKIREPESFVDLWDSLCEADFDSVIEERGGPSQCAETGENVPKKKEIVDEEPLVLLGAPTGKAASVLRKRAKLNAQTLHHIWLSFEGDTAKEDGEWRYRRVRVLVVDEGSMVPISVFSKVLRLLTKEACLEKIVILGDVLQLPSVEAGNFLCDVYPCFERYGHSVPLRTCHRASSQLIVDNATRVSRQAMPRFDEEKLFHFVKIMESTPGKIIEIGCTGSSGSNNKTNDDLEWRIDNTIRPLIARQPSLQNDKTSHFITFTKKRVRQLNEICSKNYNQHTLLNAMNELDFQKGDKLCMTKNGMVQVRVQDENGKWTAEQQKLYNGEIFFLKAPEVLCDVKGYDSCLYESGRDGDSHIVDLKCVRDACEVQHGWVTTIHKFQGSEAETIVYVVHGGRFENWQHVYTAITRAQRQVFIVGTMENLELVLRNPVTVRQTNLKDLLARNLDKMEAGNENQEEVCEVSAESAEKVVEGDSQCLFDSDDQDQSMMNALERLQNGNSRATNSEEFDSGKCTLDSEEPLEKKEFAGESIVDGFSSDEASIQIDEVVSQMDIGDISDSTPLKPPGCKILHFTPHAMKRGSDIEYLTPIRTNWNNVGSTTNLRGVSASTPKLVDPTGISLNEEVKTTEPLCEVVIAEPASVDVHNNSDYKGTDRATANGSQNLQNMQDTKANSGVTSESDDLSQCDLSDDMFGDDTDELKALEHFQNESADKTTNGDFRINRKRPRDWDSSRNQTGVKYTLSNHETRPTANNLVTPKKNLTLTPPRLTPLKSPESGFNSPRTPLRKAIFNGHCSLCKCPIKVGDMISASPGSRQNMTNWVHTQCPG